MFYGFNRGRGGGRGGGMGLGFQGSSPPWPYVGRGRGGLPRCSYYFGGAGTPVPGYYQPRASYPAMPRTSGYTPYDELNNLKGQAEAIKGQLEDIESRMHDLEAKK